MIRLESGEERKRAAARLAKEGYEPGPDVIERMVRSLTEQDFPNGSLRFTDNRKFASPPGPAPDCATLD